MMMMIVIAGRRDDAPPEVGGAASGLGRQPCQGFKDEIICLNILLLMVITYIQRCLSVPTLPPWQWQRARMSLSSSMLLGTYHSSQHHLHQLLGTIHHHLTDNLKIYKIYLYDPPSSLR